MAPVNRTGGRNCYLAVTVEQRIGMEVHKLGRRSSNEAPLREELDEDPCAAANDARP